LITWCYAEEWGPKALCPPSCWYLYKHFDVCFPYFSMHM
jgi:hypothetical protein